MGVRGAGTVCFCAQGSALCGQPAGAQGSRRFNQTLPRLGRDGTGTTPRPPALAIHTVQEVRRTGFRRLSRIAAEDFQRAHVAPRGRGPSRQLQDRSIRRAFAKIRGAGGFCRTRHLSGYRRRHRRFCLCAAAEGRRKTQGGLSAESARWLGRPQQSLGTGRRAEGSAAHRQDFGEKTAPRRLRLFHPRGKDSRAGCGHGADRKSEMKGRSKANRKRSKSGSKTGSKTGLKTAISRPLYTIGYEQAKPAAVLGELEHAKIEVVVDTRAVAASRRPGFSKRQLAASLDEAGIGYVHLQKLGTPAEGRAAARGGDTDLLWRIYDKHIKTREAQTDLDQTIALSK